MVGDAHPGPLERPQHSPVQLDQRSVAPQRRLAAHVQAQPLRDNRDLVVTIGVGQVARPDLGAQVPAGERGQRIVDTADRQPHVRDRRHSVPAQVELGEPVVVGMRQRHLQHSRLRQLIQFGLLPGRLQHQRQQVERASLGAPAQLGDGPGELLIPGVSHHTVVGAVSGIPDQLVVPDPGHRTARHRLAEDGDRRPQPATAVPVAGGQAQVGDKIVEDLVGVAVCPPVQHHQAAPVDPPDTAARVAPGHPCPMHQFRSGMGIGAERFDLRLDHGQPLLDWPKPRQLGVAEPEKLLGLGEIDRLTRSPIRQRSVTISRRWPVLRGGGDSHVGMLVQSEP